MRAQLGRLPEWFEYFAALIRTHEGTVPPFKGPYINYVRRVPLGVVGQITPWNHPLVRVCGCVCGCVCGSVWLCGSVALRLWLCGCVRSSSAALWRGPHMGVSLRCTSSSP